MKDTPLFFRLNFVSKIFIFKVSLKIWFVLKIMNMKAKIMKLLSILP